MVPSKCQTLVPHYYWTSLKHISRKKKNKTGLNPRSDVILGSTLHAALVYLLNSVYVHRYTWACNTPSCPSLCVLNSAPEYSPLHHVINLKTPGRTFDFFHSPPVLSPWIPSYINLYFCSTGALCQALVQICPPPCISYNSTQQLDTLIHHSTLMKPGAWAEHGHYMVICNAVRVM